MNATLNGEDIVQNAQVNIGLAIEVTDGLVVPNVKNAQNLQLVDLASALHKLVADIGGGNLNLDDLTGGTFTITNLGALGVDAFTPIINPPECAILGVGRIVPKPAVVEGEVAVRQMMTLSLTFDHRLNDGAPAARFLQRISQLIEQPYLLI
jgi:pyruvate dehydrogenase E2 component (dihydrolipoamide acetyltransferase)